MLGEKGSITERQFALFRILLGGYLFVHFLRLIPYGRELFSREGVFPDPALNLTWGLFPNPLYRWDSPAAVRGILVASCLLSVLFAAGIWRRPVAVGLWFAWAALFHRNNLISNPSIPYVGLLLLLTVLVPVGEGWAPGGRRRDWCFPRSVYWVAWIALAAGYTYSGLVKLGSPSWLDGSALEHVLRNPLARPNVLREWLLALPDPVLEALTWSALALEIVALPVSFHRIGRFLSWASLLGLQLGILTVVSFADLTAGMLLAHFFVLDPDWWRRSGNQEPPASASEVPEAA